MTVDGTLAVDGWAVTFGTARMGLGPNPPRPLLAVTPYPSMTSVPVTFGTTRRGLGGAPARPGPCSLYQI